MMRERGRMVAESMLLIEREEARLCQSAGRQVTDPRLRHCRAGSGAPAVLRAIAIPRAVFRRVSGEHPARGLRAALYPDRSRVCARCLAPRAKYHMHMREGAAPAVAGDTIAVRRAAVGFDEEGSVRHAWESLRNVQRTY
jgi:hypothetical protein